MTGHIKGAIEAARSLDRRLTRRSDRRRILFNARTPMNYAMVAPVHRAMSSDPRVEFYFTASESPGSANVVLHEAGPNARIVSPRRAALMRFDAYIAAVKQAGLDYDRIVREQLHGKKKWRKVVSVEVSPEVVVASRTGEAPSAIDAALQ